MSTLNITAEELGEQVSIEASGAVSVLYGRTLPDGKATSDAITAMVTANDKKTRHSIARAS